MSGILKKVLLMARKEIEELETELKAWKMHDENLRQLLSDVRIKNSHLKKRMQEIANKLVLVIEDYR